MPFKGIMWGASGPHFLLRTSKFRVEGTRVGFGVFGG